MNSKLHAVTDALGRPLRMFLTAGQRSDYIGTRSLLDALPSAKHMLADRGYDAAWYREALEDKGIKPCIPSRKGRKVPIPHDAARYRTKRTKGCLSRKTGLAMAFKLMMPAQKKWRKLDGRNRLPEIIQGVEFRDGLRHLQTAA